MLDELKEDAARFAANEQPDSSSQSMVNEPATRIRTAAQRQEDARNAPPLVSLVGCLWETPGIAILAGDTGVGKSIFAVHIGHLVSSNLTELLGLPCCATLPVLYYDFELTDRQFEKRFDAFPFTDKFLIGDTNPSAEDVESFTFDHIAADLDRTGASVLILDNITALALKTTADADVSIGIMKGLKRLQNERGISSLVLAHTPKIPVGAPLTLNHLAGSKHLSNFADSVFFLGRSVQGPHTRYVKQVKNRTDEELPGVLVCELHKEAGHLALKLVGPDDETPHLAEPITERPTSRKAPLEEVLAHLPALLVQPMPAGQLERKLAQLFGFSSTQDPRTIRTRLKDLATPSGGYVNDLNGILCAVTKQSEGGREILYSLQPIPATP